MVFEHAHKFTPDEKPTPHDTGTVGPYDALQHYRDFRPPSQVAHLGPVTDSQGHISFPSVYDPLKQTAASSQTKDAAIHHTSSTHHGDSGEHKVKAGENLWKIAQDSLSHGGDKHHPSGAQISQREHSIIEANHHAHPDLATNPSLIHAGEKLTIPPLEGHHKGAGSEKKHLGHAPENKSGTAPEPPARLKESAPVPPIKDGAHTREHDTSHGTARDTSPNKKPAKLQETEIGDGGRLARFVGGLTQDIAHGLAKALGFEANKAAKELHSVFDCAHGPRLALEHFGIKLKPMPATSQGRVLENSGLFDKVSNPQFGDYGYRHWTNHTIQMQERKKHQRLGDLGDSFIVTGGSKGQLSAANDHFFQVPAAGGYYKPGITFLRPNVNFYKAYEHYKQTGQMTYL